MLFILSSYCYRLYYYHFQETYWYTSAHGDNYQTHGIMVHIQDTPSSDDKRYHGKANGSYPEHGKAERCDVVLAVRVR